jgi:hypothetical protein
MDRDSTRGLAAHQVVKQSIDPANGLGFSDVMTSFDVHGGWFV